MNMTQVHIHIHRRTADAGFDESKHPRDGGKFSTKAGGGGEKAAPGSVQEARERFQAANAAYEKAVRAGNGTMAKQYAADRDKWKAAMQKRIERRKAAGAGK